MHRHPVRFLESVGSPQRFQLGEFADDVLFGFAASGDLLKDSALLFLRTGTQHLQRVDSVEYQVVDDALHHIAEVFHGVHSAIEHMVCGARFCRIAHRVAE
ncbi:unannotated protein [freshwater metagenome]|uniref:Unannotated protein n=1 Tax=freshwater metagenome TaxID=449393 RepID=A0A6J7ASB8_9ZZZZ